MPGEEVPPNMNAANAIAYSYDFVGEIDVFIDQFPTEVDTEKVQKFCDVKRGYNLAVRFDNTFFPE